MIFGGRRILRREPQVGSRGKFGQWRFELAGRDLSQNEIVLHLFYDTQKTDGIFYVGAGDRFRSTMLFTSINK